MAGAAPTLDKRFTNPRGGGYPAGLGLTDRQVDDLTDFLENALYDPALVKYDPNSSTDTLQPNEHDLTYSKYHPELAGLAKDGMMLSGLAIDDNDPLARRDEGLEFLNVTPAVNITLDDSRSVDCHRWKDDADNGRRRACEERIYTITNNGTLATSGVAGQPIDTHLLIIVRSLPFGIELENASGTTSSGEPYRRVFLPEGVLNSGQSITEKLIFRHVGKTPLSYTLDFLSGQGKP
jgi:hypothetical protein